MCPSHAAIYSDTGIALIMTLWSCCEMVGVIALTALESGRHRADCRPTDSRAECAPDNTLFHARFSALNRLSLKRWG